MQQRNGLTIGELARRSQVGVESIRFYERKGLLTQPTKPSRGYRRYAEETLERIQFLQNAKGLGFSLKEIGELLALREEKSMDCGTIRERAASKVEAIEKRIASLEALRAELRALVLACDGKGTIERCHILKALSIPPVTPPTESFP